MAEPEIAPDTFDDTVSENAVTNATSFTSLRSSVLAYHEENGRTYHALSAGKYALPNDERELERLDLQHNLFRLTLGEKLCSSPKNEGAKRVLDVGTGTGIWATEYAEAHPEAEVLGVDLSRVMASYIPSNCCFEVDDIEKPWTYDKPFDFIFARVLAGSFADTQGFMKTAFDNLEPGGYLEMQDIALPVASDDETLGSDSWLVRMSHMTVEAAQNLGRPIHLAKEYGAMFAQAGFIDVVVQQFKWPSNIWPRDKRYKEMGRWNYVNIDSGLEGLTLGFFTRGLGMSKAETEELCKGARSEIRNVKIHAYWPVIVCYGRKPAAT